jgi:hypothetical protein
MTAAFHPQTPIPTPTRVSDAPDVVYRVELSELGPDLSGRKLGEKVRKSALRERSGRLIFDCAGIATISPSFADEVFGRLATERKRPKIEVINASPDIISAVRFAVRQHSTTTA